MVRTRTDIQFYNTKLLFECIEMSVRNEITFAIKEVKLSPEMALPFLWLITKGPFSSIIVISHHFLDKVS